MKSIDIHFNYNYNTNVLYQENIMAVIQVRMKENTIEQLEKFQNIVKAPSKSDAVRRSIEITDLLVNSIGKGERIIIESSNGKQRQVLISGLNTYRDI